MYIHLSFEFTDEHKEILKQTVFNDTEPNTLLHDFEVILEIMKRDNHILTPALQLPLKLVKEINDNLKHPTVLGLKRPQQKSYPQVHGLYLILRASGLSYLDGVAKKTRLVIDDEMVKQWQTFNPAEKYGNLLEAWLMRGFETIINERQLWSGPDHIRRVIEFYTGMYRENPHNLEYMSFAPGWHNIGLLELFGMVDIQYGQVVEGKGIQIEVIKPTSLGTAMVALLYEKHYLESKFLILDGDTSLEYGELQSQFYPYFMDWKRVLSVPKWEFRDGTYTFKVSLLDWSAKIRIKGQATFDTFAMTILNAVGFDSDHLYKFISYNRTGSELTIIHPYMDDYLFTTDEVQIGNIPLDIGAWLVFNFDFGDNWEFDIQLEQYEDLPSKTMVEILETSGEPPEQYPDWDDFDDDF